MKKLLLAVLLVGCGEGVTPTEMPPPEVVISASNPFECSLDADQVACHCTIPEYSAQAIADMTTRCNFLRGVSDGLY